MPKELPPLPLGTSEDHHDGSYKKYQRISYQNRIKLIHLVVKNRLPVAQAARQLSIKLSTAKYIIKSYSKEDHVFIKKDQVGQVQRKESLKKHNIEMEKLPSEPKEVQQNQIVLMPAIIYVPYSDPMSYYSNGLHMSPLGGF